ncbi:MAG: putative PEP-binding protein [Anaeroplasma sp.]
MKNKISKVLSEGYTIGKVKFIHEIKLIDELGDIECETSKFKEAVSLANIQIDNLSKDDCFTKYIEIQRLMINDKLLHTKILSRINKGESAINAIRDATEEFIEPLKESNSNYLSERTVDIEDIRDRLIGCILDKTYRIEKAPYILYVDNLFPSDLLIRKNSLLGIIAKKGSYSSHTSIICRSLGLPYVVSDINLNEDDCIIIDTRTKTIIVNPNSDEIEFYNKEIKRQDKIDKYAVEHDDYLFLANVYNNSDLKMVLDYNFDGVGLYRTEFIFINSVKPLSFEEQLNIYQSAVEYCKEKPINFRTFDICDDKKVDYLSSYSKSYDSYINNKSIFEDQIKALLLANKYNNMRVMFPMIYKYEEFQYLKEWIININKSLNCNLPKIGLTVETRESLENIQEFQDVDFIAIGTNDLMSQLYNINREDTVIDLDDYIDDFINRLKPLIKFCKEKDICLSVCGEIAAIKEFSIKLYEAGIKNLSVSPALIKNLNMAYLHYKKMHK